jgi:hypothetical protein
MQGYLYSCSSINGKLALYSKVTFEVCVWILTTVPFLSFQTQLSSKQRISPVPINERSSDETSYWAPPDTRVLRGWKAGNWEIHKMTRIPNWLVVWMHIRSGRVGKLRCTASEKAATYSKWGFSWNIEIENWVTRNWSLPGGRRQFVKGKSDKSSWGIRKGRTRRHGSTEYD